MKKESGWIVDPWKEKIFKGSICFESGCIVDLVEEDVAARQFIMPGFVDAHVHIESSMLVPWEFARLAVRHGTVATVSDPHEIANVCGKQGVLYMLENAHGAALKFHFGAPSCVPATCFETAGAELNSQDVSELLQRPDIYFLSEMMNYPGVLAEDPEILQKIACARQTGKPVDGHAPGLRGQEAARYIRAGITTDHECVALDEALDKLNHGMKIIIREGSAARNFDALQELISRDPRMVMFCSDDKHPDDLLTHHINQLAGRAVKNGHPLFYVLRCACINPVLHYGLPVGLLRKGDPADFIAVNDLSDFQVMKTYINGKQVYGPERIAEESKKHSIINHFCCQKKRIEDFKVKVHGDYVHVMEALDGQLITKDVIARIKTENGYALADPDNDILKIAVINRYGEAPPAIAFVKNFGLKYGALASTVAHDSHNIIAVGADDESICHAVNALIEHQGGLAFAAPNQIHLLALPVGGLMSDGEGETVAARYTFLDQKVKEAGCTLHAPFMTLSFMALLVIPDLKLSDQGLFSGKKFSFIRLEASPV
jgi:adenine deaminase